MTLSFSVFSVFNERSGCRKVCLCTTKNKGRQFSLPPPFLLGFMLDLLPGFSLLAEQAAYFRQRWSWHLQATGRIPHRMQIPFSAISDTFKYVKEIHSFSALR
jgi:hypothetical protein